jgi:CheY-like chemotaxis protein/anti-sigma regulatory factor (Ser/Thr protein kinase)
METDRREPADAKGPVPAGTDVRTVLIVDDSSTERMLVGLLVEGIGHFRAAYAVDGNAALAAIAAARPSLVLTDLQMPGMDGLELVREIRQRHPGLPVILMTAHGSETVAVRALRSGAAYYVAKDKLEAELRDALTSVLASVDDEHRRARLLDYVERSETYFKLDNDAEHVAPLVALLQEQVMRLQLCDANEIMRVGICLDEALHNAIHHGNLELNSKLRERDNHAYHELGRQRRRELPFRERRVHVTSTLTRDEARFVIRDEGPGFDPRQLPDPTDPENLLKPSGRGLLLIMTFMDEVRHNDTGNQITMVKRRGGAVGE